MKEELEQLNQKVKEDIAKIVTDYHKQTGIAVTGIILKPSVQETMSGTFFSLDPQNIKLSSHI